MADIKWRCTVCGYIHEGPNPPEVCPICGVDSSLFERVEEGSNQPEKVEKAENANQAEKAGKAAKVDNEKSVNVVQGIKPALYKISYGIFIITSIDGDKMNGQCANTAFQITSEPPTVAIGINKQNYTHELIEASGLVGISILDQQGHDLARKFGYRSGRDVDKFADASYKKGVSGVPLLNDTLAHMEGKVINKMDCGTHTLYLVEITEGEVLGDSEPMTYAYFRATK